LIGFVSRVMSVALLAAIAFYRTLVSPLLGPRCRFYPSCSEYARQSIKHFGPLRGSWRALGRLARCHPFHPGGFDPPIPKDQQEPHG
jgi:putative membrane protein insertion efficiency factor